MTITPELAQEWLDRGGTNRKITQRRIDAMAAAIQRGEWRLTGEAIKLDAEGRVRDGQNRLHAIVQAGMPVTSVVACGVDEDAFDVMGTGRSRNAADVLHIHGYPSLNAQQAEEFAEHLTSGAGLHRGHPLLMLRNRLLGSQRDQYSTLSGREALVAIAIKAWNAWREGRTLQTLSWRADGRRAEPFPEPI